MPQDSDQEKASLPPGIPDWTGALPEVVAFDLGKVLLDFDYGKSGNAIAARGRLSPAEVRKLIDHSPLLFRLETGRITNEQFFAEVRHASGFSGAMADFARLFSDIFEPITAMIEWHAALRKQGVPTWIFSNTNGMAIEHIRRTYPFFSNFDGYILSYEQGVMKPDAGIYEALEKSCGRRGSQILYLDDRPENVLAGAARGWRTILYETPAKTFSALRAAGMKFRG